ncbi:MAG: hypothetical protein JKY20_10490 [Alphaproteobacteria bacterium]|nr:hypothetical protein [Alphaproteobacteria bacterium]
MMHAMTASDARANRRAIDVHGQQYFLSGYIGVQPERGTYVEGNEKNDNGLPQGFLVEQPPHSVTPPHFHEVNQFQVFVGGDGKIGKHDAAPVSLHYANGHTPYGPIAAGDDGVQYFTLRSAWDPGAKYMPQNRDKLKPGPRRFRLAARLSLLTTDELAACVGRDLETVIDVEEDGLQAHLLRLGPGESCIAPDPASGGGQYHMVLNGIMAHADGDLDRLSCIFMTCEEPALEVIAGPEGLELLVMQFPKEA